MGMVRHQQKWRCFLGFGLVIIGGREAPTNVEGTPFFPPACSRSCFLFAALCSSSARPNRSASVSMLVRSSKIGVEVPLGPGLDLAERLAWPLCCQQYRLSSRGSYWVNFRRGSSASVVDGAIGRRQGRPVDVMPRQVVLGFLESDRPNSDSGVFATNGIISTSGRLGCRCTVQHDGGFGYRGISYCAS
jgi:hypothetical protein